MIEPERVVPLKIWKRIEAKFIPEPNSGCWIWLGATCHGYSMFRVRPYESMVHVHRYLYEQCTGRRLSRKIQACHTCDVPSCINPAHVFPGSAKKNAEDSVAKGRHQHGERNGLSKLTAEQVREIRKSLASDVEVAAQFKVRPGTVWAVRTRKTWRHVR